MKQTFIHRLYYGNLLEVGLIKSGSDLKTFRRYFLELPKLNIVRLKYNLYFLSISMGAHSQSTHCPVDGNLKNCFYLSIIIMVHKGGRFAVLARQKQC
jgi:hypothetical protein